MNNKKLQNNIFCAVCGKSKESRFCNICQKETSNVFKICHSETLKIRGGNRNKAKTSRI